MIRGDPASSKSIFNKMRERSGSEPIKHVERLQNVHEEEEIDKESKPTFNIPNLGGGAANSIRNRGREQNSTEVEEVFETRPKKPVIEKRKVNTKLYEESIVESVQIHSSNGEHLKVLESLFKLYLIGKLDEYDISGVGKDKLIKLWEDFGDILDEAVID